MINSHANAQYLEAGPVYGVHGRGLGPENPDIFTAALKNRPQLYHQRQDETCNTKSKMQTSICELGMTKLYVVALQLKI